MAGVYREALWPLGSHRNSPDPSPTSEMTLHGSCGHCSVGHGANACPNQTVLSSAGRLTRVTPHRRPQHTPSAVTHTDPRTSCLDTWGCSFCRESEPGVQGIARALWAQEDLSLTSVAGTLAVPYGDHEWQGVSGPQPL